MWDQMLAWANDCGVYGEFLQVVNCTGLTEHPNAIGRVFVSLDSNVAKSALDQWRYESEYAHALYRLSVARSAQDPRLKAYRPLPDVVPATAHITEHIATFYLLALFLERLPAIDDEAHRNWFERLRLWLLVHCLERAALGNRLDRHLQIACSKLRLAHDGHRKWLALFGRLRTDSPGFEGAGLEISAVARQILSTQTAQEPLTQTQRALLESLIRLARHEHAPIDGGLVLPPQILRQPSQSEATTWDAFAYVPAETTSPDAEDTTSPALIPGDEESDDLQKIQVDEKASYAHQRLQANSVLLSAAVDLHFLPWSWNRPMPFEIPLLATWLKQGLSASTETERAVAAFSLIALMTGRSLRRALDISLGAVPDKEWTLDVKRGQLLRVPPRRIPGWTPDGEATSKWVAPMADVLTLPLPEEASRFLLSLVGENDSKPSSLGDLWNAQWGESPESAFLELARDEIPRIKPAMLGNALGQHAFLQTGDGVFARLLSSHPRTGLPGAMAYATWTRPQVNGALASFTSTLGFPLEPEEDGAALNAMGSQLDILEHLLAGAIGKLNATVDEIRRSGSLIDFHNALTAKILTKLYAATGARPLRDPFSSPLHFGFEDGTLFIDDKHSQKARTGRLIVLPSSLIKALKDTYLTHLSQVAEVLNAGAPVLAAAIANLARGQESDLLPFFFFLEKTDGKIRWRHASEKHLRDLAIFDCPLPLNLFRHRLATRLRWMGIDPELIDALLGHAESGASTHGDHSFRVWGTDMASLQGPISSCLSALGLAGMESALPPRYSLDVRWEPATGDADFGARARAKARRERIRAAISSARGIITAHKKGRTLDELSKAELDALQRALLTNESGLPHPFGALRFSVLLKQSHALTKETGRKVRFSHHYRQLEDETTPFSPEGPGATVLMSRLTTAVEELIPELTKLRLGKMNAAVVAATLLILQSRIADRKLIGDVLSGQNVRLIRAKPGFYLEHGKFASPSAPSTPVHRHRISNAAARLINMSLDRTQQRGFDLAEIPAPLCNLAAPLIASGRLGANGRAPELIESLIRVADQANIQTFPGVVAAYLAGRIESASLEWRDWSRLRWNRRIAVHTEDLPAPEETPYDDLPSGTPANREGELLQQEARALFSKIWRDLDPDSVASSLTANARRDMKAAIRKTLAEADGKAPPACLMLGSWVANLLERKSSHDGFLSRNAIKRYFGALSPAFAEVGYLIDLELADEDEMTEFYSDVIEGRELKNPDYVFARLKEFHRWLSEQVEVEDPVWAELPCHDGSTPVDPGIVVESDYLRAFNHLARRAPNREQAKYAALLLLCAYRFGLRGSEALGLLRSDMIAVGNHLVLIVQNNTHRRLKRKSSRRAVPLLDPLTPSEAELIDWVKGAAEARAGDDRHALLFPSASKKLQQLLRKLAITTLKLATGNPDSNIHRLRHAAANQAMLGLAGIELPSWAQASRSGNAESLHIQQLLLGRTGATRRAAWASARHLGHAGPRTAFQSYYHFISDYAEHCIALPQEAPRQFVHAIDLTRLPVQDLKMLKADSAEPSSLYGRVETTIKSLRLLARGKTEEEIGDWLGWEPAALKNLTTAVRQIDSKMHRSSNDQSEASSSGREWLTRIRNRAWNRLLVTAEKIDQDSAQLVSMGIPFSRAIQMIGSSRQILGWKAEHFQAMQRLLDYWEIKESQYAFLIAGHNASLKSLASAHGFDPTDSKTYGNRSAGHQIDAAFDDEEMMLRVTARCALCLHESDVATVRNRFELIVAFLSLCDFTDAPEMAKAG